MLTWKHRCTIDFVSPHAAADEIPVLEVEEQPDEATPRGWELTTHHGVAGLATVREEVGPVTGDVVNISLRATTVVTNGNIAIIVSNSEFVSSRVTNWSYTDRNVRFNFPVEVSYRSDQELVRRLLLQVADQHSGVLKDPKPDALLQEFGDSALSFLLRVWTRQYATTPGVLRSELNFMISKSFKEHGIEIPYPQRDLHIRSGSLEGRTSQGSSPQAAS